MNRRTSHHRLANRSVLSCASKLAGLVLTASALTLGGFAGGGCGNPSFLVTPVYPSQNLSEVTVEEAPQNATGPGGKIAIIELEGLIVNARTGGPLQAQENPVNRFVESLQYAEKDDDVKAVVLRINSPGGAVSASDTLYEEVRRFKSRSHKPVVASVQDIGASGAYYVACAADTITVQPTSIVGSVGVIFQTFNVSGTMAKIGVTSDAIKSAANKDAGSPFRKMTEEERALFQKMIDDYYGRFKSIVQSRPTHVPDAQTPIAFDGRVFTGEDSVRIGLANQTGYLRDALNQARSLANTPRAKAIMYRLPFSEQGSIYAVTPAPTPTANPNALTLKLPGLSELPPGFYYLWEP